MAFFRRPVFSAGLAAGVLTASLAGVNSKRWKGSEVRFGAGFAVYLDMVKKIMPLSGLLLLDVPAFAQGQYGRPYGGWHGPGMMDGWGMGWFGMIFNIVFWILILVGLVFLIRWLAQSGRGRSECSDGGGGSRALEILKERYARGEIDKQQYESMKKDLMD